MMKPCDFGLGRRVDHSNSHHRSLLAWRHAAVLPCANLGILLTDTGIATLAHDTFEGPFLGCSKQRETILKGFGQRDGRATEPLHQGLQRAWSFTSGCNRRSRPLTASRSNAHKWIVFGLVQRTCSLAKFGRPSASLATTSPSSTAAFAGSSYSNCAMEGKRSVKSCPWRLKSIMREPLVGLHTVAVELHFV
jgi:hypothetical protein